MGHDHEMWLGINPGLGGCAALLGADGTVELWPTPTLPAGTGSRRVYDRAGLRGLAGGWAVRACLTWLLFATAATTNNSPFTSSLDLVWQG